MALDRYVYFFADGSQETQSSLRKLLHSAKPNTFVSIFLERVRSALQHELRSVSEKQRNGLPNFHSLDDLIQAEFDESRRHPALHPLEIVLAQLGTFIAAFEAQPESPWPTLDRDIIAGTCFGELSAAVVVLSTGLASLIPLAIEAVCLAFRAGLLASRAGGDIENRELPAASWSATIAHHAAFAEGTALERLCAQIGLSGRQSAYLTAVDEATMTLGGPPSTLHDLFAFCEDEQHPASVHERREVRIYAPYHTRTVYDRDDITTLISNSDSSSQIFSDTPLYPVSGGHIGAGLPATHQVESRRQYLQDVMYNIFCEPIRWERMAKECSDITKQSSGDRWTVRPFAQTTSGRALSSRLGVDYDFGFALSAVLKATPSKEPIAVVGMAGRFPDSESVDQMWDVLMRGVDCHKEIPKSRFDPETHLRKKAYGCFIDQPGLFDPRFFNVSPREALETDPGQRLALVTAYEALEMAGFVPGRTPSSRRERVGTFFGQTSDEYKEQNVAQKVGTHFIPGTMRAFGPGRINHFFKFGGPAVSLDTACSSSSVALHHACSSIWNHECDTAIVGGMNIISSSDNYNGLVAGHFLSPTGSSKTFDNAADGYCRGETVASVVLKPLSAALDDNDRILGTILSTSTNYSYGASSITHPWAPAQEDLYRKVLNDASIDATEINYIEMHGTGTQAGDAVEMTSVLNTFAKTPRHASNLLALGAVKANLGHSESASGVTSLIKALMVLQNRAVPPHVGIKGEMNEKFPDLEGLNVRISSRSTPLPTSSAPDGAIKMLVNNFSAAGGNTALILGEAPVRKRVQSELKRQQYPVAISAKSEKSLQATLQRMREFVRAHPDISLADLSYTSTARRMHHTHRFLSVVPSMKELASQLSDRDLSPSLSVVQSAPQIAFVFTGQGAFQLGPVQELYRTCSSFHNDLDRFHSIARSHQFPDFMHSVKNPSIHDLNSNDLVSAHTAMISVQMAIYNLMIEFGVKPSIVTGHSFGEYGAMYASGVLTASDVILLVGRRATLLQECCTPGTHLMLAVRAEESRVEDVLGPKLMSLEVACLNGPRDTVFCGYRDLVQKAAKTLKAQGIVCSILEMPYAYHSSQMDAILDDLESEADLLQFNPPRIPIASTLLRQIVREAGTFNAEYVRQHIRGAVDFTGMIDSSYASGDISKETLWLEIGTHPICSGMLKATLGKEVQALPALQRETDPWSTVSETLSALHLRGCTINWHAYHKDIEASLQVIPLPSYAWDNSDYWMPYDNDWLLNKVGTARPSADTSPVPRANQPKPITSTLHKLLDKQTDGNQCRLVFETDFALPTLHKLVKGHSVDGIYLCPASVYADIALTVADQARSILRLPVPSTGMSLKDFEIVHPITVPEELPTTPQIVTITANVDLQSGNLDLDFTTAAAIKSASCNISFGDPELWLRKWTRSKYLISKRLKDIQKDVAEGQASKFGRGVAYMLFASLVKYSAPFQGMDQVLVNNEELEASASLKLSSPEGNETFFYCPYWIDSFVQLSGLILNANDTFKAKDLVFISRGWQTMRLPTAVDPAKNYTVHVKMQNTAKDLYCGTLHILEDGNIVGVIKDIKFRQLPRRLLKMALSPQSTLPRSGQAVQEVIPQRSLRTPASSTQIRVTHSTRSSSRSSHHHQTAKTASQSRKPSTAFDEFKAVVEIISQETGVPFSQLKDHTEFAEIGVDSLLTLALLAAIEEKVAVELPKTIFNDCLTIGALQRHIADSHGYESDSAESVFSQLGPNRSNMLPTPITPLSSDDINPFPVNNDIRNVLRSIIADQVGITVNELVEIGDLTAVGVDSIMQLTISSEIQEKLGLATPESIRGQLGTLADFEDAYLTIQSQHLTVSGSTMGKKSPPASPERPARTPRVFLTESPRSSSSQTPQRQRASRSRSPLVSARRQTFSERYNPTERSVSLSAARISVPNGSVSPRPMSAKHRPARSATYERSNSMRSAPSISSTPKKLSVILQGNPATCKHILFLFPDGSGSATAYMHLSGIPRDTCIVGLDSPYLKEGSNVQFSVASIVGTWVPEIRRIQPHGPYNFGGWSAGGYYAYEATRAMFEAGEAVDRLLLIDSPPRNTYEALPQKLLCSIVTDDILGSDSAGEKRAAPQWLIDHFQATIQAVGKYVPVALDRKDAAATRVFAIWATAGALERNGRINTSGWDMSTKVAGFLLGARQDFGPNGWDELLPGANFSAAKVPGTHFSMVQEPNVQQLSRLLTHAMEEIDPDELGLSD